MGAAKNQVEDYHQAMSEPLELRFLRALCRILDEMADEGRVSALVALRVLVRMAELTRGTIVHGDGG